MIDIETELFSDIANKVRERFSSVFITGEYVKSPPSFPCVSLIEMSNTTFAPTLSSSERENYVELMYEVNVYSNKTKGKKAECKEIISFIDEIMQSYNFTRTMLEPVPNEAEATIYRMLGRYKVIASKEKQLFRR